MTAAELIKILQQWPGDTRVIYIDDGCLECDLYDRGIRLEEELEHQEETGKKIIVLNTTSE